MMNIPSGPILVVEDNLNVLELLETTLRFKGYPVTTARNGQEALERIAQERPALIITDILMPKMDGYSLAHALRKNFATRRIPFIFVTATYLTAEDKAFALSLGAAAFIEKPIDPDDFLLTVAEVLTRQLSTGTLHSPLEDEEFYEGYRERLESKLRHKQTQIARTERLLHTLPEAQKPAFQALLQQAMADRDEIQSELDQLLTALEEFRRRQTPSAPASGLS
ncbi:MAG: response regulator [Chloroflexota bacterium]|jgi:CheY-like chemotaxis protein